MYKDKDKQKKANKAAAQRRRDKGRQGMTPGYDVSQGMTPDQIQGMTRDRQKKRDAVLAECDVVEIDCEGNVVTVVTKQADPPSAETVPESSDAAALVGPLDVYSADRWTYLISRDYTWNQDKQRGVRADGLIGVVVPGDPAYGPVVGGKCRSCGGPVQHQVVVKCLKCCTDGVPNAPTTPVKTFDDLPLDVQRQIDKHCSESNNGDRAGSHSRAAMTERAIACQRVAV